MTQKEKWNTIPTRWRAAVSSDARDLARDLRNRQQFGGASPARWRCFQREQTLLSQTP